MSWSGTGPPESGGAADRPAVESDSKRWLVPLAVTAVVIVALSVWAFFAIEICDQQLADSGDVVDVCRHLQVTDPPVLAAGLVVIAALGAFFTEVTAFGITLKRTVEKAEDAARATSRFELAAREAAGRARLEAVELQADAVESQMAAAPPPVTESDTFSDVADKLAEEYREIRQSMPSGWERTRELTRLVAAAKAEAQRTQPASSVVEDIYGRSSEHRIVALATVQAIPNAELSGLVLRSIGRSESAFEQYEALRALDQMVGQLDSAQRAEACRELIDQRTTGPDRHIAPGTDRWALSDRLLGPDRLNCR